jgi:hypothetical protein
LAVGVEFLFEDDRPSGRVEARASYASALTAMRIMGHGARPHLEAL